MIAALSQFPSPVGLDPAAHHRGRFAHLRGSPAWAAVFGFVAFIPYPAIAVGEHTGIQLGNLLSLLIVAMALAVSWKNKPYFLLPLLLAPAALSVVKVGVVNDGNLSLCFKALASLAISTAALTAAQFLAPRYSLWLLMGIAWAVVFHTAVGFLQLYAFSHGQFPLLFLYVNPGFLSVQETAPIIVRYIQRPFGIFPEPSAMSSSLAPWVLFWIAELFGLVQLRQRPTRSQRTLFAVAAVGGLSLIILSRSGHALITLAAATVFAVIWLAQSRANTRTFLIFLTVFGIALPVLTVLLIRSMSTRIEIPLDVDQSWQSRAKSLWLGLKLLMDSGPLTFIFGMGMGMLAPRMTASSEFETTWSLSLSFLCQTGIIGLLVMLCIFQYLMNLWRRANCSIVFAALLAVWFIGITVTTSYSQLLPIWVALGWLSVWPSICHPAPNRRTAAWRPAYFIASPAIAGRNNSGSVNAPGESQN